MVGTSTAEVQCEKCKRVYEATVIDHIDLSMDQDLIKALRTGKANRVQCPKCKKVMYLDRSIVINFEPDDRIVFYDPSAGNKENYESIMKEYSNVIQFSETLQEVGEEVEFIVISDRKKLKDLINKYIENHT